MLDGGIVRIGQLANAVGVDTPTIRFYESVGLLPEPRRRPSGYRDYDESDVERLRFVRQARSLDLPLDDVTEILALRERGEAPCSYVREVIAREAVAIDERIAELNRLRAELRGLQQRAEDLRDDWTTGECICHIIEDAAPVSTVVEAESITDTKTRGKVRA